MGEDKSKEAVLSEGLNMLSEIDGFDNAKEVINRLVKVREIFIKRVEAGLSPINSNNNFVIAGGKVKDRNIFARILAKINFAQGISKEEKLVKANYDLLIGSYVGETSLKTKKVIEKAVNGLLFIDELEDFSFNKPDASAIEFIEQLMCSMEDHRDDLVVVIGGDSDAITSFFNNNVIITRKFPNCLDLDE